MTAEIINYSADVRVLVSVRGHPFERDPFSDVFAEIEGVSTTFVDQPAAAQLMTPEGLAPYDVLCLYDMPGLDFAHADRPGYVEPSSALKTGLTAALDAGIGVVALHHAIAGWPAWPAYGDWIGGRFLYRAGDVRGHPMPDSGYRHDVRHTVSVEPNIESALAPILSGVPQRFEITDELYLGTVFERDLTPLLRSDFTFRDDAFYSATRAVEGAMHSREGWSHPPGSDRVAWVKKAENSPLVYLQFGDGPATYQDPNYRRLVANSIRWAASEEAADWARSRPATAPGGAP